MEPARQVITFYRDTEVTLKLMCRAMIDAFNLFPHLTSQTFRNCFALNKGGLEWETIIILHASPINLGYKAYSQKLFQTFGNPRANEHIEGQWKHCAKMAER